MQEIGDSEGIAVALGHLGNGARDHGRYQESLELLEKSLRLSRELKDDQLTAIALKNLATTRSYLSDYQPAMEMFEEAVTLYRGLKDDLGVSDVLWYMGYTAEI